MNRILLAIIFLSWAGIMGIFLRAKFQHPWRSYSGIWNDMKEDYGDEIYFRISSFITKSLINTLVLYLLVKALVFPRFIYFDRDLAKILFEDRKSDWLEIIANSHTSYLPEARADWWWGIINIIKEKKIWLFKKD